MSIQVDATDLTCTFCTLAGKRTPLVRSMHGLYCTDETCYSRVTHGNLVPPVECESCGENAFYLESGEVSDGGRYRCIACGRETPVE